MKILAVEHDSRELFEIMMQQIAQSKDGATRRFKSNGKICSNSADS